jgi:CDP-glycerol glycerophosphotransferase (TagB/SpsB family)
MIDFMARKNVFPQALRIGNFRATYSQDKKFPCPLPTGIHFLYAPTWEDAEQNGTFWQAFPLLAERLPQEYHLLVKLHPNTMRKYAVELEVLMGRYSKRENILFLPDIPPIYPLLKECSAYIGDKSSIGYDFLTFNRPLFFLNADPSLPLHRCGRAIQAETFDFSLKDEYAAQRKELHQYTFEAEPNWEERIHALCRL